MCAQRSWDEQHSYVRIILIVSLNIKAPHTWQVICQTIYVVHH